MTTVRSLYEQYRPLIRSRVSAGTARGYESAWRRRVEPSFGDAPVEGLRTLDVELAFASWSGSLSTRVDALSVLSSICKTAIKAGLIASNPCIGVERPRTQDADPTSRALSMEEVDRLFGLLPRSGPYRRFVLAMLYTGCRLGEVAALRVSDVDWSSRTITIRRSAAAGLHGELVVGPTKGRRVRSVPLAAPLVPIVQEAAAGKGPHELLFPGPRGGHLTSKNLSRALGWARARTAVKDFPPDEEALHWHDLRHTAAVVLFQAGVSAPDVQAILGHSSLAVTQMYANTRNDAAKRGTTALSAYWGSQSVGHLEGGDSTAKKGADLGI